MITPTANLFSSLARAHEVQDKTGRILTVRRLDALGRLRLLKAAGPDLAQNEAWLNVAVLALSITEIDGVPRVAAISERQIEAIVAELGDHGLQAVSEALLRLEDADSLFAGPPSGNAEGTPL